MKKMILLMGTITVFVLMFSGCTGIETDESWTWDLFLGEDRWNEITFTQAQINACDSDSPEDVFASIEPYRVSVFEEGTWINHHFGYLGNTLHHILPNTLYHIHVTQDCTLTIGE